MRRMGILLLSVLFILAHQVCVSQTESGTISFSEQAKKFSNHSNDFGDFANSLSGSDKLVAMGIQHLASIASAECEMLNEEWSIIKIISNEKDKRAVQEIVLLRAKMTSEAVDAHVKLINRTLPLLNNTAMVVQANKIKDDLRALKETLGTLIEGFSKDKANTQKN